MKLFPQHNDVRIDIFHTEYYNSAQLSIIHKPTGHVVRAPLDLREIIDKLLIDLSEIVTNSEKRT